MKRVEVDWQSIRMGTLLKGLIIFGAAWDKKQEWQHS